MTVLIDTDVLIDCLRGVPEANRWLAETSDEPFYVPGVVAMELLIGCHNKEDLRRVQRFLDAFSIVWHDAQDFAAAYRLLEIHRLSSGLGIPDCLIAATALLRSARLYTFNLKHYRLIPELNVQTPYQRP